MSLVYQLPFAPLPKNEDLKRRVNAAAERLAEKLNRIDVPALSISDYNKKYLKKYIHKLRPTLQKYDYILTWALAQAHKPVEKIVLIDYGGGCGLLSILAKQAGVGAVIFNDIFETSCEDAKILSKALHSVPDFFIPGDFEQVKQFMKSRNFECDAIISCDVIEHIYDIREFFHELLSVTHNVVMSTHANPKHPVINRNLMSHQFKVENEDRLPEYGHKERDALKSYRKLRFEIVSKHGNGLAQNEIEKLAHLTRGKKESDIVQVTQTYVKTKKFPEPLKHPTNTVDPLTGNWADRLTPPEELRQALIDAGFETRVLNGYYGHPKPLLRRFLARILDLSIRILASQGVRLSPYFILSGRKN